MPSPEHIDSYEAPIAEPPFEDDDDGIVVIPLASITKDKPINVQVPHFISQEALQAFDSHASTHPSSNSFLPKWRKQNLIPNLEHLANPVIHPITGKPNDPVLRETWTTAFGKELGSLAQGDNKTGAAGTDTIFFMSHNKIRNIPSD